MVLSRKPRLSIGLPVYNGARFLPAALDSLLGQTFSDFELIVSDNASTDDTAAIVQQYAQRDARIVYIRHVQNQGAAWNFNYVVDQARGKYLKWAAADDVCAPTYLEHCVAVLEQDASVICCHARTRKIDEHGNIIADLDDPTDGGLPTAWFMQSNQRHHRPDASSPRASRRFADVLLYSGWGVRTYGVIRTAALRETSLIGSFYGSEKVTMAELALRGRFYDVPETLFFQRVHEQSASRLNTREKQQQYISGQPISHGSPRLQLLRSYWRAIARAPLGLGERMSCHAWLIRYLLQISKWPDILAAVMGRRGVRNSATLPPPTIAVKAEGA
jgi:glycosyltransferase involved in cell wall biosynthesis